MKKILYTVYLCIIFGALAFMLGDTMRVNRLNVLTSRKLSGATVLATDFDGLWLWPYCTAFVVIAGIIGLRHSSKS